VISTISDRIKDKRGIQWDRSQIRVSGRGLGPRKKKVLKMIGVTVPTEKGFPYYIAP
jgi:hypothetical protein